MTLLETQRLARKISDLLQPGTEDTSAPKSAEDFAADCHAINLRLQQCEAMIQAGDRHQAIQLAETAPNLLDCVTAVEFKGADEWRAYCQEHGLSVADKIDARSVQVLNQCYGHGIATDHPLYAAYRSAVLSRNDDQALKALQSIARLNPADSNGASELMRLDAKVLQDKLRHLDDLLAGSSPEVVRAHVAEIEAFGFKNQPAGDPWRKAQTVRCGVLLEEIAYLRSGSGWEQALGKLELIHRLQEEFNVELTGEQVRQIGILQKWALSEQEKDKRDRDFHCLLAELHYRIQQSEEKDTSARYVKLPELKEDCEALHKVWRAIQEFTRTIPEDATVAFRKRSGLLEMEIVRRTAVRRRGIIAGAVTLLLTVAAISWFALRQAKARSLSAQLSETVAQRQVRAAEKALEVLSRDRSLLATPSVSAAAAAAESFVTTQRKLLEEFKQSYAKLPSQLSGAPSAAELGSTSAQLALVRNSLHALAPDLKSENQPLLESFEHRWERFLAESATGVNRAFGQWIVSAEATSAQLDYRTPIDQVRQQLAALSNLVHQIATAESGFSNYVSIQSDLLRRSAAVQAQFGAYEIQLRSVDDGLEALKKAGSIVEYSNALRRIASSEFSLAPVVKAAVRLEAFQLDQTKALRLLIGVTNAAAWAFMTKEQRSTFVPEVVFPGEQKVFRELEQDPAVKPGQQHVKFWLDTGGTKVVEWVTAGPLTRAVGWTRIQAFEPYASASDCAFVEREYGFFDGKYKLSPTEPIVRMEDLGSMPQTASFYSIGLQDFIGTSAYTKPLLRVLDNLTRSREGSPLFRAYLFLRLAEVMELQPESWGLSFAPSLSNHRTTIRRLVGQELRSGDWFLSSKSASFNEKLDEFFLSVAPVSYLTQATGLLTLARQVRKAGIEYVGYLDPAGEPRMRKALPTGPIWGYDTDGKPVELPAFTGTRRQNQQRMAPLSPLFAQPILPAELLAKAGIRADDPSFLGALPPLFTERGLRSE